MKNKSNKKLLVMAGGTGGHVFPGIAVADELKAQGWEIRWLGTKDRMEAELVPKHGIEIDFIDVAGLRGSGFKRKLLAPWMIIHAVVQAKRHIQRWRPDVVLGMGGYVSGPGGIAAKLAGVPLVVHEQNAVAGLTNQWLAKIATCTLQAFPQALPQAKVVGNPVRADLCAQPLKVYQQDKPLNLLVMGGSQGARVLNQCVPKALALCQQPLAVWHQAGKGNQASTLADYQQVDNSTIDVKVVEFIDDVAQAYQWADVIVCRSGALTVSELAAVGLPAIFVPFMHQDRQQALNADYLVQKGAALMIEQPELTAAKLSDILDNLQPAQLNAMAQAAKNAAITDATQRVAGIIKQLADKENK